MKCPACGKKAAVIQSRERNGMQVRRRECTSGHRFTTEEKVVSDGKEKRRSGRATT